MNPVLLAIGNLVMMLRREGRERGRLAAVHTMRLVASFDSKLADGVGDAIELLAAALHAGGKSNIIFLVPAAIV